MKKAGINQPRTLPCDQGQNDEWNPDFRVRFSSAEGWEAAIVSNRAELWARKNLPESAPEGPNATFTTDLASVNDIVRQARSDGYRSEHVGPHEVVR